jgi:hypothetical protein
MKRKKILKIVAIVIVAGIIIDGGIGLYLYYMPHRDVLATKADFSLTSKQIVTEYLADKNAANQKYLASDGDSKILEITGIVDEITEDFDGNKVVLLKAEGEQAKVSATFTPETNAKAEGVHIDSKITIKGVIRSGASYDEDLEMYENVILEKSDLY